MMGTEHEANIESDTITSGREYQNSRWLAANGVDLRSDNMRAKSEREDRWG